MSPNLPVILFTLTVASAMRGNLLAHSLLKKGHFHFEGRASFRKIRRALAAASPAVDRQAILRFRRWYLFHVILSVALFVTAFNTALTPHH